MKYHEFWMVQYRRVGTGKREPLKFQFAEDEVEARRIVAQLQKQGYYAEFWEVT